MKEDKDRQRKVNTCLEGSPCAEMMQKIMGEQGVGSLCEEMMRTLMKTRRESQEKRRESEKNEGPGGKE
jgi:hypothetical protein